MKYIDEYHDPRAARKLVDAIRGLVTHPWTIMEVCGGQTHAIIKHGIDRLLPPEISLLHGPGCPVCVTPVELIDKAVAIAAVENVIFCTFGDMMRVPGSSDSLFDVRARGGDVRMVYSPLDAVDVAAGNPGREVVFFAIGFETTAPANALAVKQAQKIGLKNFSLLVAQVLVLPAMSAIMNSPATGVQGFLAAGHVCTVTGYRDYIDFARKYKVPVVVTGFEPLDILQGIYMLVCQLEENRSEVENQYARSVREEGNPTARAIIDEVFTVVDRRWRGIGVIPGSGLKLADNYRQYDAELRFDIKAQDEIEPEVCISGLILQGVKKPLECPAFAIDCTPEHPLGATMVSSEGACAAYFRYKNHP